MAALKGSKQVLVLLGSLAALAALSSVACAFPAGEDGSAPTEASAPAASGSASTKGPSFESRFELTTFYRGNTHTHTNWSDGDSAPTAVVEQYKKMGYHFVVLTDHNRADTALYLKDQCLSDFIIMAGEEVTYEAQDPRRPSKHVTPVHVNAILQDRADGRLLPRVRMDTVAQALQKAVSFVRQSKGAIAQINHPNYMWALTYDDIAQTTGASLLEVANQHPAVWNAGDAKHPSVEALWDRLLTSGKVLYGVASDDMHALQKPSGERWSLPGRGWVQVAAASFSGEDIRNALAEGRFYASTGVVLKSIKVEEARLSIEIRAKHHKPEQFTTKFIGSGGKVLATQQGLNPSYAISGDEGYVRARVYGPDLTGAWIQPVRVLPAPVAGGLPPLPAQ